jgi:hypothetical protein
MLNRSPKFRILFVLLSATFSVGCIAPDQEGQEPWAGSAEQAQQGAAPQQQEPPTRAFEDQRRGFEEAEQDDPEQELLPEDPGVFPISPQAAQALAELAQLVVADPPANMPAYDRGDWPHWRDADKDCQNTRAEVLIDESATATAFADGKDCRVVAGTWLDPYTGESFSDASELDVDHVVPLKNAHLSGGWAWTRDMRATFANDLVDGGHLMAVKASANRQKGAKGPDEWRPPLLSYHCDYASHWVHIKWRYFLDVTVAERDALTHMLALCQ